MTALVTMPKPVIAAINGSCFGAGLGIALACDLRVTADTAKFGTAFSRGLGIAGRVVPAEALPETARSLRRGWRTARPAPMPKPNSCWPRPGGPRRPRSCCAERQAQTRLGHTEDHQGAVTAFLAKEKPLFAGR